LFAASQLNQRRAADGRIERSSKGRLLVVKGAGRVAHDELGVIAVGDRDLDTAFAKGKMGFHTLSAGRNCAGRCFSPMLQCTFFR